MTYHSGEAGCKLLHSIYFTYLRVKLKKVKLPVVSIVADTDFTTSGCGAHLRLHGLEPAVGLHPALWTVDHTTSTTCRFIAGFYTGTKLYCLVKETHRCE